MDGKALQNRVSKALGTAARRIGTQYIVYHPRGCVAPLNPRHRVIKLHAGVEPIGGAGASLGGYGVVLWRGIFDSLYTSPGDYLHGQGGTFFIASQLQLQPILLVKTTHIITISRALPVASGGYSGFVGSSASLIIVGWPALLVEAGGRIEGTLPEAHYCNWLIMLPLLPTSPEVADVLSDDLGRRFVVASAQLNDLGWRLRARQVDG